MDSDGANHRFITNGQSTALTPRYSPDYSKIAYVSYPQRLRADLRLRHRQRQPDAGHAEPEPDFRPALVARRAGRSSIRWRWPATPTSTALPATGGTPTRLTDTPGIDVGGSYSPDGSKVVFESDRSGSQQIYVMDAGGGNQRRISFFGGRSATPEWSPRGDQIAFTHIAGDLRIAVMTPSGGGMRYLTSSWQDEGADLGAQRSHRPVLPHRCAARGRPRSGRST
jgi:TolB protein